MCILLLTVLTVPDLVQRFRLPGIIGLILAGAIMGPHGINLLAQGEGIQLLSKIGLLYIMFWAGLEIEITSFLKNKHKSALFGLLTFGFPLLIGGIYAFFILELKWMSALLLAGMFSAHTLIAYPVVTRLRISRNEAVAVAVGGTVITDTMALLLLAVISGMAQGNMDGWFWVKLTLSLALFGALVFGLLPIVARWFFRRVESDVTYQFVFVLAMVFVCGLLAELAGVEAIIGAFLAGLVLNRLIPQSSPLMDRIGFVGNSLFIPAFLFNVGMMINLHVFLENGKMAMLALGFSVVALLSKWLAAFFTQKIYGYSADQGNLIFGLSASRAAAAVAIALIGFKLQLFDESIVNATIFLIVITCFVSTLVSESAALRIAATNILPTTGGSSPQRILVPIANPINVANLLDFAFLIKTPGTNEPVYPLSIILDEKEVREKIRQNQLLLAPILRQATDRDIALAPIHRVDVSAVSGILRAASELLATEIVIGWHPKESATERLFGSLLDNLLDESPEMLFVTNIISPPTTFKRLRVILPEATHLEPGFGEMVRRLENIGRNLNLPLKLLATPVTISAANQFLGKDSLEQLRSLPLNPEDWWQLHESAANDELTILVSARQESVSAEGFMQKIPAYLTEHFSEWNFVLVYPGL